MAVFSSGSCFARTIVLKKYATPPIQKTSTVKAANLTTRRNDKKGGFRRAFGMLASRLGVHSGACICETARSEPYCLSISYNLRVSIDVLSTTNKHKDRPSKILRLKALLRELLMLQRSYFGDGRQVIIEKVNSLSSMAFIHNFSTV